MVWVRAEAFDLKAPVVYICFECGENNISTGQKTLHTNTRWNTKRNKIPIFESMHFIAQKPLLTRNRIFIYYDMSWHMNWFTKCILRQTVALHTCQIQSRNLIDNNWCLEFWTIRLLWWFKHVQTGTLPKKASPTYPTLQKRKGLNWNFSKNCAPGSGKNVSSEKTSGILNNHVFNGWKWWFPIIFLCKDLVPHPTETAKLHHGSCHLHVCISTKFGHSSNDIGNTTQIEDFLPSRAKSCKGSGVKQEGNWSRKKAESKKNGMTYYVTNLAYNAKQQNNKNKKKIGDFRFFFGRPLFG